MLADRIRFNATNIPIDLTNYYKTGYPIMGFITAPSIYSTIITIGYGESLKTDHPRNDSAPGTTWYVSFPTPNDSTRIGKYFYFQNDSSSSIVVSVNDSTYAFSFTVASKTKTLFRFTTVSSSTTSDINLSTDPNV